MAILGLLAGVALSRFGVDTVSVSSADGLAGRLALAMKLARRQAIAEGTPAAVVLSPSAASVTSADIVRAESGGDTATEATTDVPTGVTVSATAARWEFDHTGSLTSPAAGGTVTVDAPGWRWTLSVTAATGHVRTTRVANP